MFRSLEAVFATTTRLRAGLRALQPNLRIVILGGVVVGVLMVGVYLVIWRRQAHENRTAIALLTVTLDGELNRRKVMEASADARLHEVERTLYTKPTPAEAPGRRPSVFEPYQVNRDTEIRNRIRTLEANRQALEKQIADLGKRLDEMARAGVKP